MINANTDYKHQVIWESRGLEDSVDLSARLVNFEDMYFLEIFAPLRLSLWDKLKICWDYLWGKTFAVPHSLAMSWEDLVNMKKKLDKTISKKFLLEHKKRK